MSGRAVALLAGAVVLSACGGARVAAPPARPPLVRPAPVMTTAVATPTAAPPPPVTAPPTGAPSPPLDAAWGTANPLTLVAAAADRRWVTVCQARRDTNGDGKIATDVSVQGDVSGDQLDGYFIDEPGAGVAIDAFVGSDPGGRFVAYVQGGKLVLRDTTTRMDADLTALGADTRDDLAPFVPPRAGAFDPTGKRFLYLRRDQNGTRVVVRDLASASEVVIEPGPGEVYRAAFDVSGEWVVLRTIAADTNGNGRLDWPAPVAPAPHMRCMGPVPRYPVWERGGDEVVVRVARVTGGVAADAPDLVAPYGGELVVRNPDGALARGKPGSLQRTTITRPGCASRLLQADLARETLLVTCMGPKARSDALLLAKGTVKSLGVELAAASGDHVLPGSPRLVALHPGSDAVLVDLQSRTSEKLLPGDRILFTEGARALVLRSTAGKKSLVVHDFGGVEFPIPGDVLPLYRILHTGPMAFVSPFVVDVARGVPLGVTTVRPLALATDGALLSPAENPDASHLARGPLRWSMPTPLLQTAIRPAP